MALPTKEFARRAKQGGFEDLVGGSWQQNVRSIHEHGEVLEKVIVLSSSASIFQFNQFRQYIHDLFGEKIRVEYVRMNDQSDEPFFLFQNGEKCRDYNDYNYVYRGLKRALEQAGLKEIGARDIGIDITAGTAVFSIAGAVLTLNDKIKFVYVNADGHVTHYDARINLFGAAAL